MKVTIPPFTKAKVMVVGDLMLDRYWRGGTSRISPEAPVPVVHIKELEERPGGAANVAMNIAALGSQVSLLGIIGADEAGAKLKHLLANAGIACYCHTIDNFPTITKLRIIDRNQQLIRLDFEQRPSSIDDTKLLNYYHEQLQDSGVVILSDYGKGVLAENSKFIKMAHGCGIPVLVDPKNKDFAMYRGADLVTPNFKEFEAAVGACHDEEELITKGLNLIAAHGIGALLITRGEKGMTLLQRDGTAINYPAHARQVYDVTGAGDTVIAMLGTALAAGLDLPMAVVLANTSAGIVVGKLGVNTVSIPELRRALQQQQSCALNILTEEELLLAVADARAHGEKIVMTNGCFDILHAGHVAYLEEAKALGHRLIVAINDDAAISRLKGKNRPINNLASRMEVVAALRHVDWVTAFIEDTPERLIARVLPDILVKGGDYEGNAIAGADLIVKNGGEVKILGFKSGFSTSRVIDKIREN